MFFWLQTHEMILEITLPREIFLHCLFWYNFNKCTVCEIISSFHLGSENEIQFLSQSVEHSSWAQRPAVSRYLQGQAPGRRVFFPGVRTNNPLGARRPSSSFPLGWIMDLGFLVNSDNSDPLFLPSVLWLLKRRACGRSCRSQEGQTPETHLWPQTRNLCASQRPWPCRGQTGRAVGPKVSLGRLWIRRESTVFLGIC